MSLWGCKVAKTVTRKYPLGTLKKLTIKCVRNGDSAIAEADLYFQGYSQRCTINAFKVDKREVGVGRAAYGVVERLFKQSGCRKAVLVTLDPAEGFWRKMGYLPTVWAGKQAMTKDLRTDSETL